MIIEPKSTQNLSNHILPTSSNLLGICFLIFSLVHFQDKADSTLLDDCAALAIVIFLAASIFSYLSLRSPSKHRLEKMADITFLAGICLLAATATFVAVRFIH